MEGKFIRNTNIAWQKVEDRIVVVTPLTKKVHIISGVGLDVWSLVEQPVSYTEVLKEISQDYEVDYTQMEKDIREFWEELIEKGIIVKLDKE